MKHAATYNEWARHGRHVRKGEKSTLRNDAGEAVFTRDQTDKTERHAAASPRSPEFQSDMDYGDAYGSDFHQPSAFDIGADF